MSSRSNGVTNVEFTRLNSACVVSSASCSACAHPGGDVVVDGGLAEHLGEQPGPDDEVLRRLGEEVVERRVDRAETQCH